MNELIPTIQNRDIPEEWNPQESIDKINDLYKIFKKTTGEICRELWIAHDKYSVDKDTQERDESGKYTVMQNRTTEINTWGEYCDRLPFSKRKAYYLLENYDEILGIIRQEERKDANIQDLKSRPKIATVEEINIYRYSNKIQNRPKDFIIIKDGDYWPTLKRRSWLFHEGGKEYNLREYARVQTFPDDYIFVGTYETIKDQIGNAVAPDMASYIGEQLKGNTFGDLFAGCGGLSYGLERIGKKAIWAVERESKYFCTYMENHPHVKLCTNDIKKINPIDFDKVDIITGGPPCQGFSLAGKQVENDPRNALYYEFIRFVDALKPKEFLMENVMSILKFEDQITKDFNAIGYDVNVFKVKGEEINMRQRRNRVFFIGVNSED